MAEPDAIPKKLRAGGIAGPKKCPHPPTSKKLRNIQNKSHVVQQTNAQKVLPAVVSVKNRR